MKTQKILKYVLLFVLFMFSAPLGFVIAEEEAVKTDETVVDDFFPFTISYDKPKPNADGTSNITDLSGWLHAPAGKFGFVRVENGHFVTDNGVFRIWGTNNCFGANFVTHEQADAMADRLARFGINCVRLHHMDSRDIFGEKNQPTLMKIDPGQLERLDYIIAAFKKRGIYVNLNLHVSRWLDERDGFPPHANRPDYDKGVDNFDPRLIEAQKKYATELLNHVNEYTNLAYKDEPAIAMIEVNNENALPVIWSWGALDKLPEPFAGEFQKQWNEFLVKKYGNTEKLRKAWNFKEYPIGSELVADGKFTHFDTANPYNSRLWRWETDNNVVAKFAKEANKNASGNNILRITVEKTGEVSWRPQLIATGIKLEKNTPYTLSFRVRAEKNSGSNPVINVNVGEDHENWESLGLVEAVPVGSEWKNVSLNFLATQTDEKARISINGFVPGVYEFSDVSLKSGGTVGLAADEKLENGSVLPLKKSAAKATKEQIRDFSEFLITTEKVYWAEMYRFLKEDIGVKQIVSGTQLAYGSSHAQNVFDYFDDHAYWNHPVFPGRPWDMNNWYVNDRALVDYADKEILTQLATRRIYGKPYTVSEYNHPFPNKFAAEGFPILAAFGRFQGWDGIFPFAYLHSPNTEPDRVTSFFDTASNTIQLVHFPACVAVFCRGDVKEGEDIIVANLGEEQEIDIFAEKRNPHSFGFNGLGLDPKLALLTKTAVSLDEKVQNKKSPIIPEKREYTNDTNELLVSIADDTQPTSYFVADTLNTKIITLNGERSPGISLISFERDPKRAVFGLHGAATLTLVSMTGNGFGEEADSGPVRILVAATGEMKNTGMQFENLGGDRKTIRNWGTGPILCEGIQANIFLPVDQSKKVTFYPLDESGNRREAVKAAEAKVFIPGDSPRVQVELDPKYKTVWYEIVIE
ncbi:MAG: carbohydrate binding domain-containing protein [Thermoguttaceae bacterium]